MPHEDQTAACGAEDGKIHESKNVGNIYEMEKTRKWMLPQSLQKEHSLANISAQVDDFQICKMINMDFFLAPNFFAAAQGTNTPHEKMTIFREYNKQGTILDFHN